MIPFRGVEVGGGGVGQWVFRRVSKIALGKMVWLLFKWLLAAYSAWMWNLSIVFRWAPFSCYCNICIMLSMVPKKCPSSLRYCANLGMWLLLWKACLCSLYRIVKHLPVCPTYTLLQWGQVNLYVPDNENIWGTGFLCMRRFLNVLLVRKAILRSACLNMLVM